MGRSSKQEQHNYSRAAYRFCRAFRNQFGASTWERFRKHGKKTDKKAKIA